MSRIVPITTLITTVALLLASCIPAGPQGPIKIGYIGPITGDAASYGTDTLNAARMKIEEVNAAGGVKGRAIELIAEDGRCNGADAASAAQKLVAVNKVVAIIGGQCSSETLAAAPIAEAAKIVLMSPVSSSPAVADAGDFTFRVMPSDAHKAIATARYLTREGFSKLALLSENTDYATGLRDALVAAFGADKVVFNETVDPGTKDFRSLMTRLQGTEFDVFFPNAQSDAVAAAMVQQFREAGFLQPIVSQDVADSVNLGKMAPEAVEGMRLVNTSNTLGEGGPNSFASRFRAKYGPAQSSQSFATLAYDAAGVLLAAIEAAGTDGVAMRDHLYALPGYSGAAGILSFDGKGEVEGIGYALKEFRAGAIVELESIEIE
jgi:branched-chain amino acid transport system substrate-binding protein